MHLLVNLTAILDLKDITDPLVYVGPSLWRQLNVYHPDHCYGDPDEFSGVGVADAPWHYQVDLRSILGLKGRKEAVAVSKDQWLEIVKNPSYRAFCFGGETKGVLAKKQEQYVSTRPRGYDNWLAGVEYACGSDAFGRRYVPRRVALDNWKEEFRSAKDFSSCESYAVAKGDVIHSREGDTVLLVIGDGSYG